MQRVWSTYYNEQGGHSREGSTLSTHPRGASSSSPFIAPTRLNPTSNELMDDNYSHPRRPNSAESGQSTPSTHPILMPSDHADQFRLDPPIPPFSALHPSASSSLRSVTPPASIKDNVSLTVNYLPSKFSRPHSPGIHKRKGKAALDAADVPKRGGGREAFRTGEARMPGVGDEDYDGVMPREGGKTRPKLRWNKFKWILFGTNTFLTVYSVVGLIFCLLTWFNVWTNADVIRVGDRTELILSTLAASVGIVTSLIGWSGILLNNRAFLALYTLLLWLTFALLVVPGYISYKRRTFNLEGKINADWSRELGANGRLRVQNELRCCGYFNPFVEATVSQTCYARSTLPGCKGPYLKFQRAALERWYVIVFGIVPFHIGIMVAALLCSNHITYRFGKGMMPKAYRLSLGSMAVIMDNYASQLAEQYGSEVATDVLARSRTGTLAVGFTSASQTNLDSMPNMPYANEQGYLATQPGGGGGGGGTYGPVGTQGGGGGTVPQSPFEDYPRRL